MTAKPVQPDTLVGSIQSEVSSEASPLMLFLINHAGKIALGIVLFIVAIGGYWIYTWQAESRNTADARELGQIMVISDPALRLTKLEAYAPAAPRSVQSALWFAVADAATQVQDLDKVYTAWKALSELDDATRPTALMGMANVLALQGKDVEALSVLDGLAPSLKGEEGLMVNERILLLAEAAGQYDRAIAACDAIIGQALSMGGDPSIWAQRKEYLAQKKQQAAEKPAQAGKEAAETGGAQ